MDLKAVITALMVGLIQVVVHLVVKRNVSPGSRQNAKEPKARRPKKKRC